MNHSRRKSNRSRFSIWCLLAGLLLVGQSTYAQVTPWVDILLYDGHLFVESEIASVSGYSLIDTGAEINGINQQFLRENDLSFPKAGKIKVSGAFGSDYRDTYKEIPVKISGTELKFADLTETHIGPAENQLILGAGFLKLLIFQIDYPI